MSIRKNDDLRWGLVAMAAAMSGCVGAAEAPADVVAEAAEGTAAVVVTGPMNDEVTFARWAQERIAQFEAGELQVGADFDFAGSVTPIALDPAAADCGCGGLTPTTVLPLRLTLGGGEAECFVCAGPGPCFVFGGGGDDVLIGADGNDGLAGGPGRDIVCGGGGSDELFGGEHDDVIHGELGGDSIYGDAGADMLFGGDGNDLILGDDGQDTLRGGDGTDTLFGGIGFDTLFGGAGPDILEGNEGADVLLGEMGNDVLRGGAGPDTVVGGADDDVACGGDGRDFVLGGLGADQLSQGGGSGALSGGPGDDQCQVGGSGCELVAPVVVCGDAPLCSPALDVVDDGSGLAGAGGLPALVISEVAPGRFIELYNTTAAPIDLSGSDYLLHSRGNTPQNIVLAASGVTVPAGGYATIDWGFSRATLDGGDLALYTSADDLSNARSLLDYVCWGGLPAANRQALANAAGKWIGGLCGPFLTDEFSLNRIAMTRGIAPSDYEGRPDNGETCAP